MMAAVKQVVSRRSDLLQVHDHCPQRAYVDLEVPQDVKAVKSVVFRATSRDQGWADSKTGPSWTWFDAFVSRPGGRSNLRTITVGNNRIADPEFHEHQWRWDSGSGPRRQNWLQSLRAGDVIQIIPKAVYVAWVNIVQEVSITLEYEPVSKVAALSTVSAPSNSEHYISTLQHRHQKIRLLVLEPGKFEDPIRGHFNHANLSAASGSIVDFIALSYCWGDHSDRGEILMRSTPHNVDGTSFERPFSLTRGAEAALRRLRSASESVNVWIDAVCINQDDLEERAQQVAIMGLIYSQASAVHIWLGEDGHRGIETALRIVRDCYNFNCGSCPGGDACQCSGTAHTLKREDIEVAISNKSPSFRSMYNIFVLHEKSFTQELIDICGGAFNTQLSELMSVLFENPWFTRVWVLQEVLLSRRAFVRYGGEIIPWDEVVAVNDWLASPQYMGQQPHIQWQTVMVPVWNRLSGIHENRNKTLSDGRPEDRVAVEAGQLSGILDVFFDALDLKATDPRDRIFALLTFGDETHVPEKLNTLVKPNYDKSVENVFADFTRWWIREHRSLAILSAIHCQPARTWQRTSSHPIPDLGESVFRALQQPSWAVSSEGRSRWAPANLETQFKFRATGNTVPSEELLNDPDPLTLRLQGVRVAEIAALGHFPVESLYPYRDDDAMRGDGISVVFDRLFDPCGSSNFWSHGTVRHERDHNINNARQDYGDHIQAHWSYYERAKLRALLTSEDNGYEYYETDNLPACLDPCFFVTSNGLSGLCPSMAREGDVIVLLYGGNVPYLLRSKGVETFELVGECFVNGIMKGEYLEIKEGNEQEVEVFRLV